MEGIFCIKHSLFLTRNLIMYNHIMNAFQPYIEAWLAYLRDLQGEDGGFRLFGDIVRHGPSVDWTTACIWSALYETLKNPNDYSVQKAMKLIVSLQRKDWGWAYNENVPSDPDSTLRALQFLQKVWYQENPAVFERWYNFVLSHQDSITWGIRTYTPERLEKMWYPLGWWDQPHACVSALAYNILPPSPEREKLRNYLWNLPDNHAYWWDTDAYVDWELRKVRLEKKNLWEDWNDPVVHWIQLLQTQETLGNKRYRIFKLLRHFNPNTGDFWVSRIFYIPPSDHPAWVPLPNKRVIPDNLRWFSTATAVLALSKIRQ